MTPIVEALVESPEPSVRWKVRTKVLGEPADAPEIVALQEEVRRSPRVRALLAAIGPDGRIRTGQSAYTKWKGPHWVLAALADIGYPPGDPALHPMRDHVVGTWLGPHYYREVEAESAAAAYRNRGVPLMAGRYRQCASIQGNALLSVVRLGLADERAGALADRLLHWQWPDGGWNCDRNPSADTSSFFETLIPMRGLAAYAAATSDGAAHDAARRAAEVFLTRRLLFGRATGELIRREFAYLHYPLYWHYDVLGALKGMAEVGLIGDDRCRDALDLLESLRLGDDDGWPAHRGYYRTSEGSSGSPDAVDWGGTGARRANPWVTADALAVLKAAGRLKG